MRQELFTQIGLDSGALTMLGVVAHPINEPGSYRGSIQLGGAEVGDFHVSVGEAGGAAQVDIDLAAAHDGAGDCGCCEPDDTPTLAAGGYLVLHVGSGRGGYSVVLAKSCDEGYDPVFDSCRLTEGDIFTATVLRPGRYRVSNTDNGARAALVVTYPEIGSKPYTPAEPVRVEAGEKLSPSQMEVGPAQAQVYLAQCPTRIRIELEEPFDREPEGPRYRKRRALTR
jgi:hypothetical protein